MYESYKIMLHFTLQCYQELVEQSIWLLGHLSGTFSLDLQFDRVE